MVKVDCELWYLCDGQSHTAMQFKFETQLLSVNRTKTDSNSAKIYQKDEPKTCQLCELYRLGFSKYC